MKDPLLKENEQLEKLLLKSKEYNNRLAKANTALKRQDKKWRDLFVKIQGQVMRELSGE